MLIKKIELHYRRSSIGAEGTRMRRCKYCTNNVVIELKSEDGGYLGHGHRCKILGLESNRRYAIEDGYVCDAIEVGKKKRGE